MYTQNISYFSWKYTEHTVAKIMENNTSSTLAYEPSEHSVTATVFRALLPFLYITVILFGNTLTIVAVIKEDSLRKVGNSFIVYLAVTDILMAVFNVPPFTINSMTHVSFGHILCIIFASNDIIFCTASILNITMISIDRYIAITDPLRYATHMTTKVAGDLICCVWIISVLIAYLPIIANEILTTPYIYIANRACWFFLSNPAILVYVILSWFVPTMMMLSAYGMIFRVARKQEVRISNLGNISSNLNNGNNLFQPTSLRRSHKAAKTLGLVIGIFLVCWMPNYTCIFLTYVSANTGISNSPLWEIVPWLAYSNSMFNPVIYAVCNKSFRKAFKKILHLK